MAEQLANLEKSKDLPWTLLGTATGTTAINLPSNYDELFVKITTTVGQDFGRIVLPFEIGSSVTLGGYWAMQGYGGSASIQKTSTQIAIHQVFINGSEIESTSTITVYYR